MKQKFLAACCKLAIAFALAYALPTTAAQTRAKGDADALYPNRPIRLLVGLPPGGSVDVAARIVSPKLGDALGQQIVVDNRTGAAGRIASEIAAKAPPDGYTILFAASFFSEVLALVQENLRYDPVRDFAPVSLVTKLPNVLVVPAALPVKTVGDFIAHAKASPGRLNYASPGKGSSAHLTMEMLKKQTGIDVVHVPYKGAPDAFVGLLSGEIGAMFANVPVTIPHLRSGKTRALAVTTAKRNFQLPEVPTMIEVGLPGFEISVWYGVFAPARVPQPILARLNAALVSTLKMHEIKEEMAKQGAEPTPTTREEFAAFQKAEFAKWVQALRTWAPALQ